MKRSDYIIGGATGVVAASMVLGALGIDLSCKTAETAIIQGIEQACEVATSQPDAPEWVDFLCDELDANGAIIATYTVKVPVAEAQTFQSKNIKTRVTILDGGAR